MSVWYNDIAASDQYINVITASEQVRRPLRMRMRATTSANLITAINEVADFTSDRRDAQVTSTV